MRKILYFLPLLALLAACQGQGKQDEAENADSAAVAGQPVAEPTNENEVTGTVGDGSSMNVLELVTDSLDTLYVEMAGAQVAGGVTVGDRVNVICQKTDEGLTSSIAINVSALQHLWTQQQADGTKRSLEIDPEGHATTFNMPSAAYDRWSLRDGRLLLHATKKAGVETSGYTDTFDIMRLDQDTLVLFGADDAEQVFGREN